jgi:hypothetical protein
LIAGEDFGAALPLVNAIVEGARDAPETLREFVPEKLLTAKYQHRVMKKRTERIHVERAELSNWRLIEHCWTKTGPRASKYIQH